MSLRKGDNKKTGQKYQNKAAFKITFDTKAIENHTRAAMDHLCTKCIEIIRWKMQYNKYRKATSVSRCTKCLQKNIYKSYRHICDRCSNTHKVCAKCLQPNEELSTNPADDRNKEEAIEKEMEEYLLKLRERTRRTLMRKIQKDMVKWDEENKMFYEIESGQPLGNLKFKQGCEGEDIVEEDDECEEFEEKDFDRNAVTAQTVDGENNEIPAAKPKKTQKEMLEAAKQIDFSSCDDDDDDDDEDDDEPNF